MWGVLVSLVLLGVSFVSGVPLNGDALQRYEGLKQVKTCKQWLNNGPEDCLKGTHANCAAAGCKWIPNYPGPWCQFPVPSECIPTMWDAATQYITEELGNINSLQMTAGLMAVVLVVILVGLMVWSDRRQAQEDRALIRQDVGKDDEEEDEEIVGTKPVSSTGTASASSTMRRRKANTDDVEDGREKEALLLFKTAPKGVASRRSASTPWFLSTDAICCYVLFGLSMVIHIWRLEEPGVLTYDECHFGYFVSKYFKREYLFDIHPPLAKLTFFVLGALLGHDPGPDAVFPFKGQMGTPYHNLNQFYPLRFIASFFGSLVVPVMYLCCRALKVSPSVSIVGASLVLWDTLLLTESRGILTDSQLTFWNALTVFVMLKLFTTPTENSTTRTRWMYATAICCGCAFAVKFTALATLGLIAIEAFFGIFLLKKPLTLVQCFISGAVGITVWMVWWWFHFARLIYDHNEVNWQDPEFQASLIGNEWYGKLTPPSFPVKVFQLVLTMIQVNAKTLEPHNWSSYWHNWIIGHNTRVLSAHEDGWQISVFTNPVIIWLTCAALLIGFGIVVLYIRYHLETTGITGYIVKTPKNQLLANVCAFLIFGWLLNLLPYIFIQRTTFVYHYLPGLLYAQILVAVVAERVLQFVKYRSRILVCTLLAASMAFGWWYLAPWVYAIPLTDVQHEGRRMLLGGK